MKLYLKNLIFISCATAMATASMAGSWQRVAAVGPPNAGLPLLLTDGTVLVHNISSSKWWKLKPNNQGSYVNGTWTQIASMPSNYGPLYFASAVLKDGRVVVSGGEYNFGASAWTNLGAWYDPQTNVWSNLPPPQGWNMVGDTQCVVLPDGRFVMANLINTQMAVLNSANMTWSNFPSAGKSGNFNEEGWTLMKDGTILTVNCAAAPTTQRYLPTTGSWISAGSTPTSLVDAASLEMGPQVLLPNGKVIALGGTGKNALYTPGAALNDPGTWVAAPDLPLFNGAQLKMADAPACLLPSGKVLLGASPGVFAQSTLFFEYDGATFTSVPATPHSPGNSCFQGNMLMLPTGQVLYTDFSNDVEIYTPVGAPQGIWRPVIVNPPATVIKGQAFVLSGRQFNGLSQCSNYGDDSSNATNYPIVRLTNISTGHVTYCRTFNHSTMAVATGNTLVSTNVVVPNTAEEGPSKMEVVANGIASNFVNVTVTGFNFPPIALTKIEGGQSIGGIPEITSADGNYYQLYSANVPQLGQCATPAVEFALPTNNFSQLTFSFRSFAASGVTALYFIYNWQTGLWENKGAVPQYPTPTNTSFTINSPPAKYFSAQNHVKIAIRALMPIGMLGNPYQFVFNVDQVKLSP